VQLLTNTHTCVEDKKLSAGLGWLDTLKERKNKWAARYTWHILTLGVNSTQRAEAVHSGIKSKIPPNLLIVTLAQKLDEYRQDCDTQPNPLSHTHLQAQTSPQTAHLYAPPRSTTTHMQQQMRQDPTPHTSLTNTCHTPHQPHRHLPHPPPASQTPATPHTKPNGIPPPPPRVT
jgi:hypothetical protein